MRSGKYKKEINFIEATLKEVIKVLECMNIQDVHDKSNRNLEMHNDYTMIQKIFMCIKNVLEYDQILSEEMNPDIIIKGRTWMLELMCRKECLC